MGRGALTPHYESWSGGALGNCWLEKASNRQTSMANLAADSFLFDSMRGESATYVWRP